jgi:hypothetical protein
MPGNPSRCGPPTSRTHKPIAEWGEKMADFLVVLGIIAFTVAMRELIRRLERV